MENSRAAGPSLPNKPIAGPSAYLASHSRQAADDVASLPPATVGSVQTDDRSFVSEQSESTVHGNHARKKKIGVCGVFGYLLVIMFVTQPRRSSTATLKRIPHCRWSLIQSSLMLPFVVLINVFTVLLILMMNSISYIDYGFGLAKLYVLPR